MVAYADVSYQLTIALINIKTDCMKLLDVFDPVIIFFFLSGLLYFHKSDPDMVKMIRYFIYRFSYSFEVEYRPHMGLGISLRSTFLATTDFKELSKDDDVLGAEAAVIHFP